VAWPVVQVKDLKDPAKTYGECMDLIVRLARSGLIHGDFNEFNLMVSDDDKITMIDFPQMVSIDHKNAEWYATRYCTCVDVGSKALRFVYI
jgi:RIO kinase 2